MLTPEPNSIGIKSIFSVISELVVIFKKTGVFIASLLYSIKALLYGWFSKWRESINRKDVDTFYFTIAAITALLNVLVSVLTILELRFFNTLPVSYVTQPCCELLVLLGLCVILWILFRVKIFFLNYRFYWFLNWFGGGIQTIFGVFNYCGGIPPLLWSLCCTLCAIFTGVFRVAKGSL